MAAFEYRQAEEIRDAFERHRVRYLFIGKSGAILLGYPDTTQDADLFVEKSPANGENLVLALTDMAFVLTPNEASEIRRGKDFIQLKSGPFDLDLVSHPTASRRSKTPGAGASTSTASPCATSTTSSPANKRPIEARIASPCPACSPSATGSRREVRRQVVNNNPHFVLLRDRPPRDHPLDHRRPTLPVKPVPH